MTKKLGYFLKRFERELLFSILILLLGVIFLEAGVFHRSSLFSAKNLKTEKEIEEIKNTHDTKLQEKLYKDLIMRVGALKAQDDLLHSGLPFTGQTHLLNHVVGDYLYENFGTKGLVQCKDYFLSSCYHGFILHAIADGGMERVEETFKECFQYGPSVYTQCAHGIGHGFLANGGYKDLVGALKTCDKAEATMEGFPVFNCYDGVFMENIWAVHEGLPSRDRWVKENDPLYPCNDSRIASKYLLGCWSNQPALAYQLFRGDLKKVATLVCSNVSNTEYKKMCFDGLSRQIHPITQGSAEKTFELCSVMPDSLWNNYCVTVNAGASYAVGDRNVPFAICNRIEDSGKEACFERIFGSMNAYRKSEEHLDLLCQKISDKKWSDVCRTLFK